MIVTSLCRLNGVKHKKTQLLKLRLLFWPVCSRQLCLKTVSETDFAPQYMAVAEVFGAGADAQLAVQGVLRISAVIISAAYCQSQPGGVIFAGKVVAGDQNVGAVVKFMIDIEQSIGFYTAVIFVIFVFYSFFRSSALRQAVPAGCRHCRVLLPAR